MFCAADTTEFSVSLIFSLQLIMFLNSVDVFNIICVLMTLVTSKEKMNSISARFIIFLSMLTKAEVEDRNSAVRVVYKS